MTRARGARGIRAMLAEMSATRERIAEVLRGAPRSRISKRPRPDAWSPIEHARHLVFAEQMHLARRMGDSVRFSAIGQPPTRLVGHPRVHPAGSRPSTNVDTVFTEWNRIHADTLARWRSRRDAAAADRLERHLKHLHAHARTIDRLLR